MANSLSLTHTFTDSHTHTMDCAIEDNGSVVLIIDEWVGECTVWFWKSRSSNNDHMSRCRGCSMVVALAYGLHVYAEEPCLSRLWTFHLTSTMVHDIPSQSVDLSGKWSCVRSHSFFLQRSIPTGTRIVACRLTRAGAASWVDFTNTAACSSCACKSIPRDIQCSSERHAHCHHDVAWDCTVVGAWTAWPFDFTDQSSVVLPPCCPVIPEHCSGCVGCFACLLQGCFPYVESTTCFSLQPCYQMHLVLVCCVRGYTSREGLPSHTHRGCHPFHSCRELAGACASLA